MKNHLCKATKVLIYLRGFLRRKNILNYKTFYLKLLTQKIIIKKILLYLQEGNDGVIQT